MITFHVTESKQDLPTEDPEALVHDDVEGTLGGSGYGSFEKESHNYLLRSAVVSKQLKKETAQVT